MPGLMPVDLIGQLLPLLGRQQAVEANKRPRRFPHDLTCLTLLLHNECIKSLLVDGRIIKLCCRFVVLATLHRFQFLLLDG